MPILIVLLGLYILSGHWITYVYKLWDEIMDLFFDDWESDRKKKK